MRILWVKSELLHPVDKGGRIRTYQMLRSLSRRHEITYLCLNDGMAATDALQRAGEYCSEVVTVPLRPPRKASPRFFLDLLLNLVSTLPYSIARYRSAAQRAEVERLARRADLVVCDFLTPSQNIPTDLRVPKVLFQHNVEAVIWKRRSIVPSNVLRRAYMHEQWRRMHRFERGECHRFDHVIAVSEEDAETMRSDYGIDNVSSVPTGVDLEYFSPNAAKRTTEPELIFVGSMDWMPNEEGIRWFVQDVFGAIRARVPNARLNVVGRSPSPALRALATPESGIEITGTVPDVRPYLARAALSVVPLRIGGGTRLKIYEAMAMGVPVVSTGIGAEGLPLRDGEEILIADTADSQANAIVGLLRDRDRAERMAEQAQRFVREQCSWDAVAEQFLAQCQSVKTRNPLGNREHCTCEP
jgi:sugar transferase (PEP-CTERM/EpsH1 system associated)